jgi:hypothetical protein
VAKTLGPTANVGLGFWAQTPIILSQQYPFNQYDWPTPQVTLRYNIWTTSYNFALLNQPPPFVDTTLEARAPHFSPAWTYPLPGATEIRSLALLYTMPVTYLPLLAPESEVYDLPPQGPIQPLRSWTWSYNLSLIGQDQLPVGEQVYATPLPLPPVDRTFINALNLNLLQPPAPLPFNQYAWPLPGTWATPYRDYTSYSLPNINLFPPTVLPIDTTIEARTPHFTPPRAPLRLDYDIPPNLIVKFVTPPTPFSQDDWPINLGPVQPLRSWTWSYNLNLIGQDKLPTGEQVTDLPPRAYPEPATRTWSWTYNLNLVGKDRLPVGEQVYDRPSLGYIQPLRSWVWNYNLNLIGQDFLPVGDRVVDLPPYGPQQPAKTWTWNYNLNLIGKDQLPVGEQITDLPPRGYPPAGPTWAYAYNVYFAPTPPPPVGVQVYDLAPKGYLPAGPTWTWQYNLNLIGQDKLPVGEQFTDLPPKGYEYSNTLRTWLQNLITYTLKPLPYGEQVYDLPPRGPLQPANSWTWSYNLNLIGQDALPVGEQISDLPPRDYLRPTDIRTWINQTNQALLASLAIPPPNQYDWPNPQAPLQPLRNWSWSYNLNLIGKDALPVGKQVTDLPPQAQLYYTDSRTWINRVNLALITRNFPFNQYDWPISGEWRTRQQLPAQSWTSSFPLSLIGKDKLPTGKQSYDLPPLGALPVLSNRTWAQSLNLALIIIPPPLPKNQYDWPLPGAYAARYREPDRSFTSPYNPNLFVPPPPIPIFVAPERPWVRDYWDCDEWGNLYPGSGIRRG